jgi:hypothetical protein
MDGKEKEIYVKFDANTKDDTNDNDDYDNITKNDENNDNKFSIDTDDNNDKNNVIGNDSKNANFIDKIAKEGTNAKKKMKSKKK